MNKHTITIADSWSKTDALLKELNELNEFVSRERSMNERSRKDSYGTGAKGALLFAMAHVGHFLEAMGRNSSVAKAEEPENEDCAKILSKALDEEIDHMRELKKLFEQET